jgi:hypothetical protein
MRRIRQHLSYANVMATIAVFLVLSGGTAVALSGSNTVFTDDIVDNEVRSADVRNDALTGGGLTAADLRPNSVGTSEVATDSLNGGDINESSVGIVPNADKLDGFDSSQFLDSGSVKKLFWEAVAEAPAPLTTFASVGPYALKARCTENGGSVALEILANGPAGSADFEYSRVTDDAGNPVQHLTGRSPIPADTDTSLLSETALNPVFRRWFGTWVLTTGSVVVHLDFHAVARAQSAERNCYLYGTAMVGT